jgi:NTP pyrophosphatase (non-canonical NTP hydrolase)
MNFEELTNLVNQWARDRQIIPNSTALTQSIKTLEELAELQVALNKRDLSEAQDAYGDILVTLIIGAELAGLDLVDCLEVAYNVIKDRRGYLTPEGLFVKEA